MVTSGRFDSTATVRADDGWQAQVSRLHGRFKVDVPQHGERYRGSIRWHLGQRYRLVHWMGAAERLTRGPKEVESDPTSMYELVIPLTGEPILESRSEDIHLAPGDMALVRLDTDISVVHSDPCAALALLIPETELGARLPRSVPLIHLDRRNGLGAVGFEAVRGLADQASGLTDAAFDTAARHVLDLLLLAGRGGGHDAATEIYAAVREYIRQHADAPDLNVASVAHSLGWSVRRVQQVLQLHDTTATDLIRTERLNLSKALLVAREGRRWTIGEVAFLSGFSSHASFSRAFRNELGCSPSEFREQR